MSDFGIRLMGGGAHQSKTMMFEELDSLLITGLRDSTDLIRAVVEENALGKRTKTTRILTFRHMASLYGLSTQPAITKTLFKIWRADPQGRRLNALIVALARDPLLRDSASVIARAGIGSQVHRSEVEAALRSANPGRMSEKTIRSLAQHCNATWTQSGHLKGRVKKIRQRASPTPSNIAFAALLATVCGFRGPSILSSMWVAILDLTPDQALDYLRRAQAVGLAKIRSAGDVTEIMVRQPMGITLGVRELEHVR
jgi:hypothetical protein